MSRTRKERMLTFLDEVRQELLKTAEPITAEEFTWEPRPGMKSAKALLEEIGTMERMHTVFLTQNEVVGWQEAVRWSGQTLSSTLDDLKEIREETLRFFQGCSDEEFEAPRPIPEPWQKWWGQEASPEAMLSWIMCHEYYHLGQLIYNRWLLGYNPYEGEEG